MNGVDYNHCLCLPKAGLKTDTNPNVHHSVAVWVRFGFQLDSLEKSDPLNARNRVEYYEMGESKLHPKSPPPATEGIGP